MTVGRGAPATFAPGSHPQPLRTCLLPALRASRRLLLIFLLAGVSAVSRAQGEDSFTPEQAGAGAKIYGRHCAPCHGPRMAGGDAVDLRKFPRDQRERFTSTVSNGKASMPPWRDILSPEDIANLWAYVLLGEKQ